MGAQIQQSNGGEAWTLAGRQHGVVTRGQLEALGYSVKAIRHRVARGRLHPVHAGVYAVGRPELTLDGRFIAAVLACGPTAALSHESAAQLWGIRPVRPGTIEVSITGTAQRRRPGIVLHRRRALEATTRRGIPVTTPVCTLIDLATRLQPRGLDRAVNEADRLDLTTVEDLQAALETGDHRPGSASLKRLLDPRTFRYTRSDLERDFIPIALAAGLSIPLTCQIVNGFEVDFFWPALGLVVETDGWRHHRTPIQQAKDRMRDQAHTAAGLTPLRFTHGQIRYEPAYVRKTLKRVARRLR
jgi:very-short-patch-repair endonuclease